MNLTLGCIADDLTGATDIGLMLAANGMPCTLSLGVPDSDACVTAAAHVVALKVRTAPVDQAVDDALRAADWLLARGARQLFYKYCSTFDSTRTGNIGPITDALLERVDDDFTVLLPAFPENGRTVHMGTLYVDGVPLAESSMRHHPLTPMRESSVARLMDAQTAPGWTGEVHCDVVRAGVRSLQDEFRKIRREGYRYAVVDTLLERDFKAIAAATVDLPLLTGASGIASAIPAALREQELIDTHVYSASLPKIDGYGAVLAGSCSATTLRQVERFAREATSFKLDPLALSSGKHHVDELASDVTRAVQRGHVLVHSSTDPQSLEIIQTTLGVERSAMLIESALATIAAALADAGTRKFVVAGGETSGAVAAKLGLDDLIVGPRIEPGVPWMLSDKTTPTCIAFKSGNFGGDRFFHHALDMLP